VKRFPPSLGGNLELHRLHVSYCARAMLGEGGD
jgi:hypothetical protein